jgi:hypothetical protein
MATLPQIERGEMLAQRFVLIEILRTIEQGSPGFIAELKRNVLNGTIPVNPPTPPAGDAELTASDNLLRRRVGMLLAQAEQDH